jgi:uncharacterized membrane protein (DUF2068 family)
LRFLLFSVVAYGVWRFANSRLTIAEAFDRELPVIRNLFNQLGFNLAHSSLLNRVRDLLHLSQTKLTVIAGLVAVLALVSLAESYALWQAKRWGEYFAMIVTSLGLPFEIYELANSVTVTKVVLFILNLALVLYLMLSRRLFGARGGKEAYESRLQAESVLDEAAKAAAAAAFGASVATAAPASLTTSATAAPASLTASATAAPAGSASASPARDTGTEPATVPAPPAPAPPESAQPESAQPESAQPESAEPAPAPPEAASPASAPPASAPSAPTPHV